MKVLITGASSGIGRDMARILAKLNYNLILVARNEDGLTKIKNELETENNKINITIYPMDLNIKENCYKLYENEKNIDVLINNAGFGLFGEFAETDLENNYDKYKYNSCADINKTIFKRHDKKRQRKYIKCSINSWIYARTTNGNILCDKKLCCCINESS